MILHQFSALHHLAMFLSTLKQNLLAGGFVVCLLLSNIGLGC